MTKIKKFNQQYFKIILILFTVLFGCTKDIDVKDQYDWNMILTMEQDGFVFEQETLTVSLIQERIITSDVFFFSYMLIEGDGYFEMPDGSDIGEGMEMEESNGLLGQIIDRNQILKYVPTSVGTHKIKVGVYSKSGFEHSEILTYEVSYSPFTFIYATASATYPLNVKKPTKVTFLRDNTPNYQFQYLVTGGSGTLYNGTAALAQATDYEFANGITTLDYLPTTLGEHTITVKATAPDGAVREAAIVVDVAHQDYSIIATPQSQSVNVNESLPLTVELNGNTTDGITYQLTHEYDPGSVTGVVRDQNNNVITPGNYTTVNPGNYNYSFTGNNIGAVNMKFKAKDSNNQLKEDAANFTVNNVPYTFTGSSENNEVYINDTVGLNFSLTNNTSTPGITYTISYSQSQGNGTVLNGTTTINPSNPSSIAPGQFTYNFVPSTLGDHTLNFAVTDNFGQTNTVVIHIEAIHLPVTFTVNSVQNTLVGQNEGVNFNITPIENIGVTYQMSYTLSGGSGILTNTSDVEVAQGVFFGVNTGNFVYHYKPTIPGNHTLNFQLKDSNGQIINKTVTIVVAANDYTLTCNGGGAMIVNTSANFVNSIQQTTTDSSITYQVMYSITSGSGIIKDSNGNTINTDQWLPITIGATTRSFTGTTVGNAVVQTQVKDSNNIIHTCSSIFTVNNISYTFTGSAQSGSIYVTESTGLNFSITEGAPSGTSYEMMYSITSGSGTITNSGNTMNSSTYYPVNVGAFSWNFTAAAVPSNVSILFTVRNTTTGVTATQTINITVANYPACTFTFDATSTSSTADVNQSVPVNLSLIEGGINCTVTYQMRFTTTGSGTNTFTYNGTAYTAGQLFTVTPGNFSGTYKGVSAGVHDIDFIVVNSNSTPITHNDAVSITFNASDFTLNCSGGGALFLNGTKEFINSFYQTQNDPAITYQVRYTLGTGSTATGTVKDINGNVLTLGQWYPISVGATSRTFTGTSVGTANVFTEIKDSNNIVHSCTTVMTVNNISYTFTGSAQSGSIYVTESTGLNFSITEGAPSGTAYEMMYSITSGSGTITNSGNTMTSSTYYPVNVGAYSWNFTAAAVPSNVSILFTVRNTTTGVTATQTVNIVVANYPACTFTFDATSTSSTADVNQSVPVNLSLIEGGINCTVTYQMRFTTTGSGTNTFTYNGTAYTAGQLFTVTPGNFSGTYKGVSAGVHDIDFIVVNSNSTPITHNDAVSITFNASDFTLNCSGGGALFLNGTKEFINSFYQTQNDPAITYQVRYTLGTGSTATGTVKDINGNVLTLGQWYPISVGATSRTFTGTSVGTANVFTEIKDSNNIVHSCTTVMTVNNISYTFTGSAQSGSIYVTESTGLNFSITEGAPSGTSYEMMYSITSGSGTITNSGNTMNSSTYYPVNVGAFSWNFTAAAVPSNVSILFTVRNTTTGVTATQTINITVANYPACTFTFDATSTSSTADVNQSVPVNLSLIEGGINCTVTYQMRFTTTGSGTNTFTYNGTAYMAGQLFTVTPGNFSGTYKGVSAGVHDIDFIVVNSNSTPITHNDAVSITFNASDFTLNCSGGGALFLNGTKEFINSFYQTQNDPAITYQVRYTLGTGSTATGTVKDINGNVLTLGQWYPISVGATSRTFTGTSVGTANVLTEIKDSNNIVHSCTTVMTVNNISYTFTGSAQSGSIYVTESTGLNFSITEGAPSGTAYEMMYSITSGSGTITNSGNTMTSSTYYPVNVGAYSWNFTAAAVPSNVSILFTVRNTTTGVTATQTVNIVVANYPACTFTFDATSTSSTADVNQSVPVNLSLIEGGINCTVTYQMRFTTTGSGTNTFTYNGTAYTAGQLFTVTPGNFSGTYKGVSAGVHDIDFIVVNSNSTPITHNDAVSITFNASDFTLNCSGGGALFLNGTKEFINSFYQTQNDPAITYQVRYTLGTGSTATGTVKDINGNVLTLGQWYPISVGATSRTFTGTSVGTANVFTEIKDSNNIVHSCTTVMTVNNISYTFTGSAQSGSIYVTESTGLNFSITEGAPSGTAYEMMYSITSGSGTITNSGNTMTSSTYYPVNVGAYSWNFTAAAVPSNVSILFTVRNTTTGVTATQTVNIVVANYPACTFTFDATSTSSTADVNQSVPVNLSLIEGGINCTVTYQMRFTTTGSGTNTFTYNGTAYTAGQLFTVTPGNFSGTYKGVSAGVHDIDFIVVNSNSTPITHNDAVSITFNASDFTLNCSGGGALFLNGTKEFINSFYQTQNDPAITYQVRYTLGTGSTATGTVKDINGNVLTLGQWYPISVGATSRTFTGTSVGTANVFTEIKDSNNIVHSCTTVMTVNNISYNFTGSAQSGSIYITESTGINFSITEGAPSGTNYEMMYSITSGSGTITNSGNTMTSSTYYPVNVGAYSWNFTAGNTPSNVAILFTVRNTTTGVTATQTVNIVVSSLPYCDFVTFDAQALSTSAYMNTSAAINFFLQPDNYCQGDYQMKFNTNGTGTFTYNGTTYQPNVLFTIIPGNFSGTYTGSTTGNHNIVFTVYNSMTTGIDINDNVNINYYQTEFDLTCYGGGSVNVGEFDTFTNIIDQDIADANVTYQSRYTITTTDGAGTVTTNDGTNIPLGDWVTITSGTTNRRFYGTVGGDVTLLTEIRETGNNTTIQSCTSTFEVIDENCDYTFVHADESNGQGAINTLQTINFQILPSGTICNTPYMMYYTTKRNGVATSDGYFINGQNNIPIQDTYSLFQILPGNFTGQYTTDIPGDYEISFYVNNPNAAIPTQVKTAQIQFIIPVVTITPISQNNSIYVQDTATYTLSISGGGAGTSSVEVNPVGNSLNSILKINGTTIPYGVAINGISDTFTITLTPSEVGDAIFSIEVIKNGITASYNINLHSLIPPFTLQNVNLDNVLIWSDEQTNIHATVATPYTHSINYTFTSSIKDQYGNTVGFGSNNNVNGAPPSAQSLLINPNGIYGNLIAYITVTNQYGYSQMQTVSFIVKDILPNINTVDIQHNNVEQNENLDFTDNCPLSTNEYAYYYEKIILQPNLILGKYQILKLDVTVSYYDYQPCETSGYKNIMYTFNYSNNYVNHITLDIGTTNDKIIYLGNNYNHKKTVSGSTIYGIKCDYNYIIPKKYIRNLNFSTSNYTTITLKYTDTNGNIVQKIFTFDEQRWGLYNAN